jgi:hypothetical protein
MMPAARLAAFALPLAGLAALWGWSDYLSRQGTDWLVPIQGYDPRDLLRGHYVEFSYDWPRPAGVRGFGGPVESVSDFGGGPRELCLHGAAPRLERVSVPLPGTPCVHPARAADADAVYSTGLTTGRVYIPQTRSNELTRKLTDPELRGFVLLRQRDDGTITPRELRFRPLTEAEREAREAERREREAEMNAPLPEVETP